MAVSGKHSPVAGISYTDEGSSPIVPSDAAAEKPQIENNQPKFPNQAGNLEKFNRIFNKPVPPSEQRDAQLKALKGSKEPEAEFVLAEYAKISGQIEALQKRELAGEKLSLPERIMLHTTPLDIAAKQDKSEVIKIFKSDPKIGIRHINQGSGASAVLSAAGSKAFKALRELLKDGNDDINTAMNSGQTPLGLISRQGIYEGAEILLDHDDIKLNQPIVQQGVTVTAASLAATKGGTSGDFRILDRMLKHPQATPDAIQEVGGKETLLTMMTGTQNNKAVEHLANHEEIDPNAKNADGLPALHLGASLGYIGTVDILLKAPKINAGTLSDSGQTASIFTKECKEKIEAGDQVFIKGVLGDKSEDQAAINSLLGRYDQIIDMIHAHTNSPAHSTQENSAVNEN